MGINRIARDVFRFAVGSDGRSNVICSSARNLPDCWLPLLQLLMMMIMLAVGNNRRRVNRRCATVTA